MSFALPLAAFALLVFLSAICSGSEIALYSISRPRLDAECAQGHRSALWIRPLVKHETWLLATLLVANIGVTQGLTLVGGWILAPLAISPALVEVAIAVLVTPPTLVLGELFPKDLFRRRPHTLLGAAAPFLHVLRLALAPLVFPIQLLTSGVARLIGSDQAELSRVQGREAVIELLRERETQLQPAVEKLARNVLELRSRRVERVMIPWKRVEAVRSVWGPEEIRRRAAQSPYSRYPVVSDRGTVEGYVHQLELLSTAPAAPLGLRPLLALEPDTPLDRALARLRASCQRAALVGSPTRPLGWVTLKDLVEEISGELSRW